MEKSSVVLFVVIVVELMATSDTTIVNTLNGRIQGTTEYIDGVAVDIYRGIPYAVPPIGNLRFKAPLPIQNWTNILNATEQPNSCMQSPDESFGRFRGVEMWNPNTQISEDCLYLNIWVPKTNDGSKMATMLWLYGGSYVYGSITLDVYDGRYLAAKNGVIVASMQYRMSVLGFLYVGTEDAPGNMGLLDQQLAMKWIHENIEYFNGDKDKISLFGESSGASSVSHHLLAQSSWPYFNRAILQSASSLAPWAIETPQQLQIKAMNFSDIMQCPRYDWLEMVECLRNKSAEDLQLKQWNLINGYIGTFNPTVDGTFLTDYPENLLTSGAVKNADIIAGTTTDEGEFFLVYFFQNYFLPERLRNPVPLNRSSFLEVATLITGHQPGLEMDLILYAYETSKLPSTQGSYTDILDDLLGDIYFKCPVRDWCLSHTQQMPTKGQTYVYTFDYRSLANPWPSWMGSLHGYEIEFVFGLPYNTSQNFTDEDRTLSNSIMKYMTNFAKTGDPNDDGQGTSDNTLPVWRPFDSSTETHLSFSQNDGPVEKSGFRTKECTLWGELVPKISEYSQNCRVSRGGLISSSRILVLGSFILLQSTYFDRFHSSVL